MRLLIVTGMSGAGKSQVVDFLEDQNWFCVDNLPPALIPKFTQLCQQSENEGLNVALVVDIRGGEFFGDFLGELENLDAKNLPHDILFLNADDEVLVRRYKEGRRRHPLADQGSLVDGIKKERRALEKISNRATYRINTSRMSVKELREKVQEIFLSDRDLSETLSVTVLSFGFKHGLPLDADMVFDARFLPNPFYVDELRPQCGEDPAVQEYVESWPETQEYWAKMRDLVQFVLPQYVKEGRRQVVIAIGCTGGQHRSVYLACRLFELLGSYSYSRTLVHRDVKRNEER
jgi:Predicted P-loop-containing kinase